MSLSIKSIEIDQLRHLLCTFDTFALLTHVNPDGDAIGAIQGFAAFLRAMGRHVYTISPNAYPDFLSFLDRSKNDKILIYKYKQKKCEKVLKEADVIICLDMSTLKRMDALGALVSDIDKPKVVIDHHPDPEQKEFDLILSNPEMSSSCEWVYRIICALDMVAPFPHAAVEPLYTGIMTDTNNFSNSVTAATFETAAELMYKGVDKEKVQQYVFGSFSEHRMRLMAYAVYHRMVLVHPYRAAYILLSLKEQEQFYFRPGDSEGFVNIPLNIKDIEVSMLFVETPDYIRVSLRSKNGVDVNEMARRFFNGGGHTLAAGGRLYGSFAELPGVIAHVLEDTFGKPATSLA